MSEWRDLLVGDRMAVDQAFTDRVQESEFTNQEWGLIMTATELDIEHADDAEAARLVADTEAIESIMPELESVRSQGGPMAMGDASADDDAGVVESIKGALGLDAGDDDGIDREKLAAAESLAQAYAEELQRHLESNDDFERVRRAYSDETES
mgnify:CR=1 FL=1|jgi:hypothetical protein